MVDVWDQYPDAPSAANDPWAAYPDAPVRQPQAFGLNPRRAQQMADIQQTYAPLMKNKSGLPVIGRGIQMAGVAAGQITDTIGEGLSAADKLITGGTIGKGISGALSAAGRVPIGGQYETVGGNLQNIAQDYGALKKAHPIAVGIPESALSIGSLFVGGSKPLEAAGAKAIETGVRSGEAIGTAAISGGEAQVAKAATQAATKKALFINDLALPYMTPKTKAQRFKDTVVYDEQGLIGKRQFPLTEDEQKIASYLSGVKGLSPKKSLPDNIDVIKFEIENEHQRLINRLRQVDVKIPRERIVVELRNVKNDLVNKNYLRGDAATYVDDSIAEFNKIYEKEMQTPEGLYAARKKFDNWVKDQKPDALDVSGKTTVLSDVQLAVRGKINDLIESRAPSAGYTASTEKMSNLIKAEENLAVKAAQQKDDRFSRAWDKIAPIVITKGHIGAGAAAITGGAIGATTLGWGALPVAAVGGLLYVGGRAVNSSTAKKLLGAALIKGGKAIGGKEYKAAMKFADELPKTVPPEKQLLLGHEASGTMSALPMSEKSIKHFQKANQATEGDYRARNFEGNTPMQLSTIRPPVREGQTPSKLLTYQPEMQVSPTGKTRPMTPVETEAAQAARVESMKLGLSPDIYKILSKAENRRKYDPIFSQLSAKQSKIITQQINDMWKKNHNIEEIMQDAASRAQDLIDSGINDRIMLEAIAKARKK